MSNQKFSPLRISLKFFGKYDVDNELTVICQNQGTMLHVLLLVN